jgi:signal transduction histidine kinase
MFYADFLRSVRSQSMKIRSLKHKLHSVREFRDLPTASLLLRLEWMLLGFTGLTMLLAGPIVAKPAFIWLTLLSVGVLALMRLKSARTSLTKVLYTLLELFLLTLPTFIDSGMPYFPLLGLVVVMRSCERFERLGRFIAAGLTFGVFALSQLLRQGGMPDILLKSEQLNRSIVKSFDLTVWMLKLNAALSFGLALLLVMLLINALLDEHKSREKLVIALEQLRQYSLRIENQSTLQERNRIAREIHDSLGHTLTAQSIQLDSALLLQHSNTEESGIFLKEAKQLCKQALQEVRQSVAALRTDPFRGKSLDQIATALVQEFRVTTAIETTCMIGVSHPIPPDVVSASYRVLQEALTNIARHSAATGVILQLFTQDGTLNFKIQDNGKGFDPTQNSTGFGLQSMEERINALGGQFKLSSQPGSGCLISGKVPLVLRLLT